MRFFVVTVLLCAATVADCATIALARRYPLRASIRHAVSFDIDRAGGQVVVADHDGPAILWFNANGDLVRTYAKHGTSLCQMGAPRAVAFARHGVVIYDSTRHHLLQFESDGACAADDVLPEWESPNGVMETKGDTLYVAGDDAAVGDCVFFTIDLRHPTHVRTCLGSLSDQRLIILFARQYLSLGADSVIYADPYEAVVRESRHGQPAETRTLGALDIPQYSIPANDIAIRSNRKLFFEFYNGKKVLEGVAAVTGGFVAVTRTPANGKNRIDLNYYARGASVPSATASLTTDAVTGVYPVSVRGDGKSSAYLLVAHGTWPAPQYEVYVYEMR